MSNKHKMTMRIVTMTPEWATRLLSRNEGNRRLRPDALRDYMEQIRSGYWTVTHQGIALSIYGDLLDGQHRLTAIVRTGISIDVPLFEGCDPGMFPAIDRGAKRSISDSQRVEKGITEPLALLEQIRTGMNATHAGVGRMLASEIGESARKLYSVCPTTRRGASSASVKAGVIIQHVSSVNDEVIAQYRHFVLLEYDFMHRSILALEKQLATGQARSMHRNDLLARSYKAFSPGLRNTAVIRVSPENRDAIIGEIRSLVNSRL